MSINQRSNFDTLTGIVAKLRAPGGCPWDRKQTHQSLSKHLVEECYEAMEAFDEDDPAKIKEELGDILLQVMLHSRIAEDRGLFSVDDVVAGLSEKLVRRHPHVFSDDSAATAEEVESRWETKKRKEKGRKSVLEGVPSAMPALAHSQSIHRRAANAGFDWDDLNGAMDKLDEEIAELKEASTPEEREEELGDVLSTLVNVGRKLDLDMEAALRKSNRKFIRRFSRMEELCRERRLELMEMGFAELEELWQETKGLLALEEKAYG